MFDSRRPSAVSWLVVFLGNPGPRYAGTRHNAGFLVADAMAKKYSVTIDRMKFKALIGECTVGSERVMLMKPQTYMNLSGEAVIQAVNFYKLPPERVIVVSDEISLPIGKLRVRPKGSAGGHNGLKNIIEHLHTESFPRIRLGVGMPPDPDYDMKDWVLAAFRNQDAVDMAEAAERACRAIECYITEGADKTMNKFN